MNKLLLSAVAGFAAVSPFTVQAEPPAPPPVQSQAAPGAPGEPAKGDRAARGKERLQKMQANLGLTDEQSQKIQAIMTEQREAMKGVKSDTTLTADQKKEKMKAARADVDAKIAALLTPEQKAKWEQLKKDRPGKGGGQ
jgi:Spy/CpxP family protein refolding chaperone